MLYFKKCLKFSQTSVCIFKTQTILRIIWKLWKLFCFSNISEGSKHVHASSFLKGSICLFVCTDLGKSANMTCLINDLKCLRIKMQKWKWSVEKAAGQLVWVAADLGVWLLILLKETTLKTLQTQLGASEGTAANGQHWRYWTLQDLSWLTFVTHCQLTDRFYTRSCFKKRHGRLLWILWL